MDLVEWKRLIEELDQAVFENSIDRDGGRWIYTE